MWYSCSAFLLKDNKIWHAFIIIYMCRYVDINVHINLVKLQNIRKDKRRKQRAVTCTMRGLSLSPTFEILLRIFFPSYINYFPLKQSYALSNIIMGLYVSPIHSQLKFAQFTSEKHVSSDLAAANLKLGLQNWSTLFFCLFPDSYNQ